MGERLEHDEENEDFDVKFTYPEWDEMNPEWK